MNAHTPVSALRPEVAAPARQLIDALHHRRGEIDRRREFDLGQSPEGVASQSAARSDRVLRLVARANDGSIERVLL